MTEDSKAYWAWLQLSLGEGSLNQNGYYPIFRIYHHFTMRTNPMAFDGIIYPKRTQTIVAKYIGRW